MLPSVKDMFLKKQTGDDKRQTGRVSLNQCVGNNRIKQQQQQQPQQQSKGNPVLERSVEFQS